MIKQKKIRKCVGRHQGDWLLSGGLVGRVIRRHPVRGILLGAEKCDNRAKEKVILRTRLIIKVLRTELIN